MKKLIISFCMQNIKKNSNYTNTQLNEIEYGLVSIYLSLTKIIFILIVSFFLGIFKETMIFMIFFNVIRLSAFGLHATKSWICWITSTIAFIIIPLVSKHIVLNLFLVQIICLINVLLIFKNSPADTKKKPIVNRKRRKIYNTISTFTAVIYSICAITINNSLITNFLVFSLILENILISPLTYRLFKLPYNNYIEYIEKHPDFVY